MLDLNKTFHVYKYLDVEIEKLHKELEKIEYLKYEMKDRRGIYHYWIEGKSVRGVFVHHRATHIDVYTSFLANETDYSLLNIIAIKLRDLTGRHIINEFGTKVDIPYETDDRERVIEDDIFQFEHMIKCDDVINFPGVYREVFIGENLFKELRKMKPNDLRNSVFKIAQRVNYKYPEYLNNPYYDFTFEGDDFGCQTTLITNEDNLIISYNDYISLKDRGGYAFINNKILKEILPKEWELLDEFNVAACILNPESWNLLFTKAKERDLYDQLNKRGKYGKKTD